MERGAKKDEQDVMKNGRECARCAFWRCSSIRINSRLHVGDLNIRKNLRLKN